MSDTGILCHYIKHWTVNERLLVHLNN